MPIDAAAKGFEGRFFTNEFEGRSPGFLPLRLLSRFNNFKLLNRSSLGRSEWQNSSNDGLLERRTFRGDFSTLNMDGNNVEIMPPTRCW